jgi:tRNA 2-thiouridine synthesizing protein A
MRRVPTLTTDSTDPGSQRDFTAFAKQTGNPLVAVQDGGREWSFYLQRR